jgi:hypothetical protein
MKSILRTLRQQPCREQPITENEQDVFSNFKHIQRYHPAVDRFPITESTLHHRHLALPSKYWIDNWVASKPEQPKIWSCKRTSQQGQIEDCEAFIKVVHLLDPINMIKEKYNTPEHPLLPQSEKSWKETLLKLHSHNNQAYVDNVANFVLSRFRELNATPHCVLYYGCATGISQSYQFNISTEFYTYRQCRWFWKGMKSHGASLVVSKPEEDIEDIPNFEEIYKELTTCPFENDLDENEGDIELEPIVSEDSKVDISDIESVHSVTFDTIEDVADDENNIEEQHSGSSDSEDGSSDSEDGSSDSTNLEEESSSDSDETIELDLDISLEMPNMPIIMIYQEAQEGVIDDLLEEDEIDGHKRGTQGWEARWIAWLFQVVAVLSFLQKAISFTHNDLHSNNIVWRSTTQKFLYYRNHQGTVWRVPTFGKIFSLIDFGRSIFRLGPHLWISDDHWPNQDAGDQYNFGPFFDSSKPKNTPNPSFDLCRLSVSLIDGLFDEKPPKKKGKSLYLMSEEGSWKVFETSSPLYNLLWSWTVDDAGQTIYADKYGNDKYDGFDLYIRIAHDVHNAIPSEQIHKTIFTQFKWDKKVDKNETVYSLGC